MNPLRRLVSFLRVALAAALWLTLAVLVARIIHDFYGNVDRAIYAAVDDGEAAIAYSLATLGRYGFLPSPTLYDMSRLDGQFNYGPWYFYAAGALIWLFGYSLTLVRSIHLWSIVLCVAAGAAWFRARGRVAPAVFCGFAVLDLEAVEWPMARPDSFVSVFAVGMIVSVGLAFRYRRARWWLLAGVAAICGAFTHLVALSLVPAVVLLFAAYAVGRLRGGPRDQARADIVRGGAALFAGAAAGLAMFYASFGFDVATQWTFLTSYRAQTASPDGYIKAVLAHFHTAFWITPIGVQASVWLTLVAGWVMLAISLARPRYRHAAAEYLMAPLLVWTLYFASNGKYTNYHAGYAILHHVMFAWTVAAILWLVLEMTEAARPAVRTVAGLAACALVLGLGLQQTERQFAGGVRQQSGPLWVPFSEYAAQVLHGIPARATAWGTVFFGNESPDRVQMVQEADGGKLVLRIDAANRVDLAPDFLVRAYPEQRDDLLSTLHGDATMFSKFFDVVFPQSRYRLVSLIGAAPYGVVHVYQRVAPEAASRPAPMPQVSYYDGIHRQWRHRVGAPVSIPFVPIPPATLQIGFESSPQRGRARSTVEADLPTAPYLLKVAFRSGEGRSDRRMIAVTPTRLLQQTITELGAAGDFSMYRPGDREVYALIDHPGGLLSVLQFDDGAGAAIESVTVYPITDLIDPAERSVVRLPLPAFPSWVVQEGVHVTVDGGRARVDGNADPSGYQWTSPPVQADKGDLIDIQLPSKVLRGDVCVGAVNGNGAWLVPADAWRTQFQFKSDATRAFSVIFANCQATRDTTTTAFEVQEGGYFVQRAELYADRLVNLALDPERRYQPIDPSVLTFPPDLKATRVAVSQPVEPVVPADLNYVNPGADVGSMPWKISAKPSVPYGYLVKARTRRFGNKAVLLVQGRLDSGGATIGLLQNEKWAGLVSVTTPGPFTLVVAPRSSGRYSIIVANESKDADTSLTIDRIGVLPEGAGR